MKIKTKSSLSATLENWKEFIQAVFWKWKVRSEKFVEIYNDLILEWENEVNSLYSIISSSIEFSNIQYDFWLLTDENNDFNPSYWTIWWKITCCSPYFVTKENAFWERTISFSSLIKVDPDRLIAWKSSGMQWNLPFTLDINILSEEMLRNSLVEKIIEKPSYSKRLDSMIGSVKFEIEKWFGSQTLVKKWLETVLKDTLSKVSISSLREESRFNKEKKERDELWKFWMIPSYKIYWIHKNWYDWGEWWNKIVDPKQKYWSEVTLIERKKVKEVLLNEEEDFFSWETLAYWWWAWSDKLDFLVDEWKIERLHYIDKSDTLLVEQKQIWENKVITYWDYTSQQSILGNWINAWAFVWWELWNQREVTKDTKTYEDLIVQWIKRYIYQSVLSKPDWWKELLGFFTDDTKEKDFLKLYDTPLFDEVLFQTVADSVDREELWFSNHKIPDFGTDEWKEREHALRKIISYTPEFWKKSEIWNLSRLWFTVNEWMELPLRNEYLKKNMIKKWWEFICVNPTTRINKKWIQSLIKEQWWGLSFEKKISHDHWMILIWAKHSWLLNTQEWKEKSSNLSQTKESKESVISAFQRFKKTIIITRIALLWLLWYWLGTAAENFEKRNIEKMHQENSYLKEQGISKDTIRLENINKVDFIQNRRSRWKAIHQLFDCTELTLVQRELLDNKILEYVWVYQNDFLQYHYRFWGVSILDNVEKFIKEFWTELSCSWITLMTEKISISWNEMAIESMGRWGWIIPKWRSLVWYIIDWKDLYMIEKCKTEDKNQFVIFIPTRMYFDNGQLTSENNSLSRVWWIHRNQLIEYNKILKTLM